MSEQLLSIPIQRKFYEGLNVSDIFHHIQTCLSRTKNMKIVGHNFIEVISSQSKYQRMQTIGKEYIAKEIKQYQFIRYTKAEILNSLSDLKETGMAVQKLIRRFEPGTMENYVKILSKKKQEIEELSSYLNPYSRMNVLLKRKLRKMRIFFDKTCFDCLLLLEQYSSSQKTVFQEEMILLRKMLDVDIDRVKSKTDQKGDQSCQNRAQCVLTGCDSAMKRITDPSLIDFYQEKIDSLKLEYISLECKKQKNKSNKKMPKENRQIFSGQSLFCIAFGKKSLKSQKETKTEEKFDRQRSSQSINNSKINDRHLLQTLHTDHLSNGTNEQTFSVKLSTSKTHHGSISIFQKSDNISSFFKNTQKNSLMDSQNELFKNSDQTLELDKQSQVNGRNRKMSNFLRRSSSISKVQSKFYQPPKTSTSSFYRQSNFLNQSQKKGNRISNNSNVNRRSSAFSNDKKIGNDRRSDKKNTYVLRTSQTEAESTVQVQTHEVEENADQIIDENLEDQPEQIRVTNDRKNTYMRASRVRKSTIVVEKKPHYSKKRENRRKGFSKKVIEDTDSYSEFEESKKDITRTSLWKQNQKQPLNKGRTSIFRSSGYIPKKTLTKQAKARFQDLNRKKYLGDTSNTVLEDVDLNENQGTKRSKNMGKELNKGSSLKNSEFKVDFAECANLNRAIYCQTIEDESIEDRGFMFNVMRSKYDLNQRRYLNEGENSVFTEAPRPRLNVLQTEILYRSRNQNNKVSEGFQMVDYGNRLVQKINQLGQKYLSKEKCTQDFPDLTEGEFF